MKNLTVVLVVAIGLCILALAGEMTSPKKQPDKLIDSGIVSDIGQPMDLQRDKNVIAVILEGNRRYFVPASECNAFVGAGCLVMQRPHGELYIP